MPPSGCFCKSNVTRTPAQMSVKVMLAGIMGHGCSGDVKAVTENWRKGNVKDSGLACAQQDHACHNE